MQITIFGANGRVGSLVVTEALKLGYSVTAFVYGSNSFEDDKNLKVVQGNIYNLEDVKTALQGSDCVISTLGSWGTPKKDILTEGMKNIIPAMQKLGINKIISLTGAGCNPIGVKLSFIDKLNRLPLRLVAPKVLNDAEDHMQQLYESGLDWTILKSPVMNRRGNPNNYKLEKSCPMPWVTINRESVAKAIVEIVGNDNFVKQSPYIKRA
jgi:putative NADH-flavin reductase